MRTKIIRQRQARAGCAATAPRRRLVLLCNMTVLLGLTACGCGSEPKFKFDELDLAPVQAGLTEFSLGKYTIPIPAVVQRKDQPPVRRNRLEFDFRLFAIVPMQQKSKIEDAWKRREGTIRDQVIRVCRDSSMDELMEPELAMLKARLVNALKPQLGDHEMRQLLITEVMSQEI